MSDQITPTTIYLDHAATTPVSATAAAAVSAHLEATYGNPSSLHQIGRQAHDVLGTCRATAAQALGVEPTEVIFTGSGTESDNLALVGLARAHQVHGKHLIVSAIEHKAVLAAAHQLEREGFSVTYLPVDEAGKVSVDALAAALCPETTVVSIMYANNEIGTIEPITEIVTACRTYGGNSPYPLVHTDACQAVGLLPVAPKELGVDALTCNSAKIYGPKGVGLLYLRQGCAISPVIVGGDQEGGIRAGTENVALVAGFVAALVEAVEQQSTHAAAMATLQTEFVRALTASVPGIRFNGHPTDRLPNNVHVTIPDIEGESLVLMLNEYGICCATGSACSSLDLEPSYVLAAIGQDEDLIHGSLRFSFGRTTTVDELQRTAQVLGEVATRLRAITACTTAAYKRVASSV